MVKLYTDFNPQKLPEGDAQTQYRKDMSMIAIMASSTALRKLRADSNRT